MMKSKAEVKFPPRSKFSNVCIKIIRGKICANQFFLYHWKSLKVHTQTHCILVTYSLHVHCLLTMNRFLSSYQGRWVKPILMKFGFFISSWQNMTRDGLKIFEWTKLLCFQLFEKVKPLIIKQDTKYCKAISIGVWIACEIHKIEQGANLFIYSELFAIGEFIISWCFERLCMLSMWCIGFSFIAR